MTPERALKLLRGIAIAGILMQARLGAAQPARLPLESFFAEPDCRAMQMSPDGHYLAFLTTLGYGKVGIALMDLVAGNLEPLVSAQDENIKIFSWKGSDYIVYAGDVGGAESYAWRSLPIAPPKAGAKRKVTVLSDALEERAGRQPFFMQVIDELRYNPAEMLVFGPAERDGVWPGMLRVNVRTGHRTGAVNYQPPAGHSLEPYRAQSDIQDYADNTGALRARLRMVGDKMVFEVVPQPTGAYVKVREFSDLQRAWEPLFFAADNETLYLYTRDETVTRTLQTYNVRSRALGPAVFNVPDGEISAVLMSWDRRKLTGVIYETDKPQYRFFDEERAHLQQVIDRALPVTFNRIMGSSDDETKFLILAAGDRDPGTYYVLDKKRSHMGAVGRVMRQIDPAAMRPMEPITITARDGLVLHGYLTRPAGDGGPGPLIVHPHGGPYGVRDEWGFDREVQFLANRGYAVLQINYRGSGGYGVDFLRAGFHEWGGRMQDDLSDAVKWAIDQGLADPQRVAIYGASYGGYATLAGLVFTPQLYCCGANYVGPSDLEILPGARDYGRGLASFFRDAVGDDRDFLRARSPVHFVDRLRVPLFNAYGENDSRVDFRHWTLLESALKQHKKDYEILVERNEGHGFDNEKNRLEYYRRLEAFFARHLGSAPSGPR